MTNVVAPSSRLPKTRRTTWTTVLSAAVRRLSPLRAVRQTEKATVRVAGSARSSRTTTSVPGGGQFSSRRPRTAGSRSWIRFSSIDHRLEALALTAGEQHGLDEVDDSPLDQARAPRARLHHVRQSRQPGADPVRRRGARARGQAALGHETILEAAQRRGRVRVGGGDREVRRLRGRLAVERRVAGAAADAGRLLHQRGVARLGRVEPADELRVGGRGRPVDAERRGLPAQPRERALVGLRLRPQDAAAAAQHQGGGGHPREERDLGVVAPRSQAASGSAPSSRRPPARPPAPARRGARRRGRVRPRAAARRPRAAAARALPARRRRCAGRRCAPARGRRRWPSAHRRRRGRASTAPPAATPRVAGCPRPPTAPAGAAASSRRARRSSRRGRGSRDPEARPARRTRRGRRSRSARGGRRRGARCASPGRGRATPADRSSRTAGRRGRRPAAGARRRRPRRARRAGSPPARRPRAGSRPVPPATPSPERRGSAERACRQASSVSHAKRGKERR